MKPEPKRAFALISALLTLAGINSTPKPSEKRVCNHDITSQLNQSIIETLHVIDSHPIVEHLQFYKARHNHTKYEVENTKKLELFGDKIYFRNIEVKILDSLELSVLIRWDIPKKELRVFKPDMNICVHGFLSSVDSEKSSLQKHWRWADPVFKTCFHYENISIIASQSSINDSDSKIQLEYDAMSNVDFALRWPSITDVSKQEQSRLKDTITPIAELLLRRHFNHNEKLLDTLKMTLSSRPEQRITAIFPGFSTDDEHYCYFIPSITYYNMRLKYIILTGLSNFQSLTVQETIDHSIYTLVIGPAFGSLIIANEIENGPVEFSFRIERMTITFDRETRCVSVDIKEGACSFSNPYENSSTTWQSVYSSMVVYFVEQTFAKSIMPSMEVWRIDPNKEYSTKRIKKTINKMLLGIKNERDNPKLHWFSSSTTIESSSKEPNTSNQPSFSNSTAAVESYNYQILFDDVAIKVISTARLHITNRTDCEFFRNLNIDHKVKVVPITKSISTEPGTPIMINFHGNFTPINLFLVKPEKSRRNNTCQYQIRNENGAKVILPPAKHDDSKIKKKLDASLLATMTDRIIRNLKTFVCSPFDICTQSVQFIDDYFQRLIDSVLEKCSLQRIK